MVLRMQVVPKSLPQQEKTEVEILIEKCEVLHKEIRLERISFIDAETRWNEILLARSVLWNNLLMQRLKGDTSGTTMDKNILNPLQKAFICLSTAFRSYN